MCKRWFKTCSEKSYWFPTCGCRALFRSIGNIRIGCILGLVSRKSDGWERRIVLGEINVCGIVLDEINEVIAFHCRDVITGIQDFSWHNDGLLSPKNIHGLEFWFQTFEKCPETRTRFLSSLSQHLCFSCAPLVPLSSWPAQPFSFHAYELFYTKPSPSIWPRESH